MSTRDEVLAALEKHADGLTSKELAPMCPACECDQMIVGRVIAALKAEDQIHAIGLREGATIYKLGGAPNKEPAIERITLGDSSSPRQNVSQAARDIAAMRQGSRIAAVRAPDRAPTPVTTPSPARPAVLLKEPDMSQKKPVAERVVEALKQHGQCNLHQLAKYTGSTAGSLSTMIGKIDGVKRVARGIYALAGAEAPKLAPANGKVEKPRKAKKARVAKAPRKPKVRKPTPQLPKNGDARFAIDEDGSLGITSEEKSMKLKPAEFARLRDFIERSEQVWSVSA